MIGLSDSSLPESLAKATDPRKAFVVPGLDTGRWAEAQAALKGHQALSREDNAEQAMGLAQWSSVLSAGVYSLRVGGKERALKCPVSALFWDLLRKG